MGSSSSFTVGLLNALHAMNGHVVTAHRLASEACEIEIDRLGEPIGKQDQFIAAYGGLQFIQFHPDGHVSIDPVICASETRRELNRRLMVFYLGGTRAARDILTRLTDSSSTRSGAAAGQAQGRARSSQSSSPSSRPPRMRQIELRSRRPEEAARRLAQQQAEKRRSEDTGRCCEVRPGSTAAGRVTCSGRHCRAAAVVECDRAEYRFTGW